MNPVYYAIVRRVTDLVIPTKKTEDFEAIGLLSGTKFYFVNRLKLNQMHFKDNKDPPTNIRVVMDAKLLLRNVEENHIILRDHRKEYHYLLQFVDTVEWTTHAAFETFPVMCFRKRTRRLYLKKKRSTKAKSKRITERRRIP